MGGHAKFGGLSSRELVFEDKGQVDHKCPILFAAGAVLHTADVQNFFRPCLVLRFFDSPVLVSLVFLFFGSPFGLWLSPFLRFTILDSCLGAMQKAFFNPPSTARDPKKRTLSCLSLSSKNFWSGLAWSSQSSLV